MTAYDAHGRRVGPKPLEAHAAARAAAEEQRREANRARRAVWVDDDGKGRDWQARRSARRAKMIAERGSRPARGAAPLSAHEQALRDARSGAEYRDGAPYKVKGKTRTGVKTEVIDADDRHVVLVMQTACRATGISWAEMLSFTPGRSAVIRRVTAQIAHERTHATWAQISYAFRRAARDHRRCWGRDQGPTVRRALAAGDPVYTAVYTAVSDAYEARAAAGIAHLVTGETVNSGLIGPQGRGRALRLRDSEGNWADVYGG